MFPSKTPSWSFLNRLYFAYSVLGCRRCVLIRSSANHNTLVKRENVEQRLLRVSEQYEVQARSNQTTDLQLCELSIGSRPLHRHAKPQQLSSTLSRASCASLPNFSHISLAPFPHLSRTCPAHLPASLPPLHNLTRRDT